MAWQQRVRGADIMTKALILFAFVSLAYWNFQLQKQVEFLHAWNVVKKIRVDRLERAICE